MREQEVRELSKKIAEDTGAVLEQLYAHALENYQSNGKTDYEAGIVEGIKRVQEELGYIR
jgi:hypothetical protein